MRKNLFPRRSLTHVAFTLATGALGITAKAQQTGPSSLKEDSTRINTDTVKVPVEIRGIRINDRAPFAVSNITQKEIAQNNNGQSLPYLLGQQPSVVTSSDDGLGIGYASMTIRGTDIGRTNMTINGIPVNDPESQTVVFVDFGDLASSTSSIQIQRGVGSSTNGSGAFGASVNVYNLDQAAKPSATISNAFGSYHSWKHTIQAGSGTLKGGFNFDIRLSKISSDGYVRRAFTDLTSMQFLSGWKSKDEKTSLKFNILMGKERTGQAWNGISAAQMDADRRSNTLGEMGNGQYYNDQTDNYWQNYYQLFADHKFSRYWNAHLGLFLTRGYGFYNEYRQGDNYTDYGLSAPVTGSGDTIQTTDLTRQLWLDNYYYGAVYSASYHKDKTDFTIGGNLTRYDGKHYGYITWDQEGGIPVDYRWYNLPMHKYDATIYAKLEQQFASHFYAYGDLQYRYVQYDITGFRKNPDIVSNNKYNFINPKVGLSYLNTLGIGVFKVYGSFAVANKEPNRDDFEASPFNKPHSENLQDWEAGAMLRRKTWNITANVYYMNYKNQLVNTGKINDVGAYTRTNVKNSYRSGIELSATWEPANWLTVSGNATFSRNKIKEFTEYADLYDAAYEWIGQEAIVHKHTNIAFAPAVISAWNISLQPFIHNLPAGHSFFIEPNAKYVGRQYIDNTQNKDRSLDPYGLVNLRFRYVITNKQAKNITIVGNINNIFSKKYINNGYNYVYAYQTEPAAVYSDNAYFPQATINYNIGLSVGF